ncbi:hypothetical protein FRB99_008763 [Tulasnella sp. 403]|nr:hypothetical protein FRB99_008763 [Tulasnella sp. 403]
MLSAARKRSSTIYKPEEVTIGREISGKIHFNPAHPANSRGSSCDLFTGHHAKFGKVAMKRPRTTFGEIPEEDLKAFQEETETWGSLRHRNILLFLGTYKDKGYLYMVSPWIANGALADFIKVHPEIDRPKLLRETADALAYLHEKKVIHGDVKGANILVSSDIHAYLCDFGLSRSTSDKTVTELKGAGTVRWQSPELWSNEPKSFKSDVYAFGMTICEILSGRVPLHDLQDHAVYLQVSQNRARPSRDPLANSKGRPYAGLWEIAERCWEQEPDKRPEMETVLRDMKAISKPSREMSEMRTVEDQIDRESDMSSIFSSSQSASDEPQSRIARIVRAVLSLMGLGKPRETSETILRLTNGAIIKRTSRAVVRLSASHEIVIGSDASNHPVALKRLRVVDGKYGEGEERRIKRQAKLWEGLRHEFILRCLGFGYDDNGVPYVAAPWMDNGSLLDYICIKPDCDRQRLLKELAAALVYLHSNNIVHGDINARNVLVSQDLHAQLCDFDLAKEVSADTRAPLRCAGSFRWQSPEVWKGESRSFASDVYAFGMTIYEVLTCREPFHEHPDLAGVLEAVTIQDARPDCSPTESPDGVSWDGLWEVAKKCWVREPKDRPSMTQVLEMLTPKTTDKPAAPKRILNRLATTLPKRASKSTRGDTEKGAQNPQPARPLSGISVDDDKRHPLVEEPLSMLGESTSPT